MRSLVASADARKPFQNLVHHAPILGTNGTKSG